MGDLGVWEEACAVVAGRHFEARPECSGESAGVWESPVCTDLAHGYVPIGRIDQLPARTFKTAIANPFPQSSVFLLEQPVEVAEGDVMCISDELHGQVRA